MLAIYFKFVVILKIMKADVFSYNSLKKCIMCMP